MRKGLIYWLAILLAILPLLGSFSKEAAAASTRVAVIKELKGTVKVKKAGGSKEFTAFAKMSLNEGDVLAVGSGGSAVLQFANGTSEDDKMTVASNAKLTFSKLSNKKGTTTKVSMWSGSAWVDVKSITNKEDQFTLETPTAVMGVRGTHLLVTVNPNTGATNLMVAAGVVQTTSTGGGGQSQNVYPTQNALITKDGADGSDVTIAPADLEALMQQGDVEIVKAIIQGAKDITEENEQYVQRYENGEVPTEIGGTNADLERFKNNTQNLLGALVTKAVETGLISQDRMNQLIDEASNQTGFKVDVTKSSLQLTEAEKAKQEAQRKKEEAQAKLEAERKAKEEAARKTNEEMIRKLEEDRKAKEKAAQEAAEAKKKEAQEKYEGQLSPEEKKNFNKRQEETKAAQNSASPSPSPSQSSGSSSDPGPALSSNANLSDLSVRLSDSNVNRISFGSDNSYAITVPNTTGEVIVKPTLSDAHATVKVAGGQTITSGHDVIIPLASSGGAGSTTTITLVVTAENGTTTKSYTIVVTRQASILNSSVWIPGIEPFNPEQAVYNLGSVSSETEFLPLDFGPAVSNRDIVVANNGAQVERSEGSKDRFEVPLVTGANRIEISVTSYVVSTVASLTDFRMLGAIQPGTPITQTYTINVTRQAQGSTTDILSFNIGESQVNDTIIDYERHYVFIEVPKGSSLLLPANFELSPGATAYTWNGVNDWNERASGELQSFDGPVVYRISAEDGMFTDWLVYVHYPLEVNGIHITYGEGEYVSAVPVGDSEYVAHVNADIGTNKLHLYPYGIYFMNTVYQLVDGERVLVYNGVDLPIDEVTENLVEGWYDFIFFVEEGGGDTIELELHLWVGDGMPEAFEGFSVATDNEAQSGAVYYDPTSLFVEVGEYEGNIIFGPSSLPEGVQLDAMLLASYDSVEVLQPNNGYYSIGAENLYRTIIAVLSSDGRKWAYQVQFIPDSDPDLYGVALYALENDEYIHLGNIEIDESGSGNFDLPEELLLKDIYVLPMFNYHTPFTKVEVNGETLPASDELKYRVAEFSGEETIPISLTSPSGKFTHSYTIELGVAEPGNPAPPQLGWVSIYNMNNGDSLPITINDLMNAIYDPIYYSPPNPPTMNLGLELAPMYNGQSIEVYQGNEQLYPTNGKYLFTYSGSNVTLTIIVTSEESNDSRGYTLVVSPISITNAGITNLKVGEYTILYYGFNSWDYYYVIPEVEGGQQQFAFNDLTFGIASNASATVKLNGSTDGVHYDEQQFNYDFVLNNVDSNLISIEVTAEAGNSETYNLYIVKNHSPYNLVLNDIVLSTQSDTYSSSGTYSNVTKSYWYSPEGNLAKEVESITFEPVYGNGSGGVHSRVYKSEDGTEMTADGNGKYTANALHFGHNSFIIDVYDPDDKYYQEYLYNVWRDGLIEVWDVDGMDLLSSESYTASNNINLTIPFDTTRLTFKTILNSPEATIKAKYKVGDNEYVEFSSVSDGTYSDEFLFEQSTDTIVLEIYQPNTQYYTYTIHLVRPAQ